MNTIDAVIEHLTPVNQVEVFLPSGKGHQMGDVVHFLKENDQIPDECRYALLGVPDREDIKRSRNNLGTSERTRAFRGTFYRMFNHFQKSRDFMTDLGDMKILDDSTEESILASLAGLVEYLVSRNITPIIIGADSRTTLFGIRGILQSARYDRLGLLCCDSSVSLLEDREGEKPFMEEFSSVFPENSVIFFGARRALVSPLLFETIEKHKIRLFYKDKIRQLRRDLLFGLNSIQGPGEGVIFSFDMNSCDSGSLPGSMDPLPGGFTPDDVIMTAKTASRYAFVKYLDLVGLNPETDIRNATCSMAALFLFYFLSER